MYARGHFETTLSSSNETRISDGRPADAARSAARTLHLTDGRQHAKGIVWHEGAIGGIVSPSRASYLRVRGRIILRETGKDKGNRVRE